MPSVSARCASSVAYSPGIEISATLASRAALSERGASCTTPLDGAGAAVSSPSAASNADSGPSTAITTSVGPASAVTPSAASASRFAGVPIATSARPCARSSLATRINRTLST